MNDQINIEFSAGRGKRGRAFAYIRPAKQCLNRSRRVDICLIDDTIKKWFSPLVNYYQINGAIIGSNNPKNALKEYYRVCKRENIGQKFEVVEI